MPDGLKDDKKNIRTAARKQFFEGMSTSMDTSRS